MSFSQTDTIHQSVRHRRANEGSKPAWWTPVQCLLAQSPRDARNSNYHHNANCIIIITITIIMKNENHIEFRVKPSAGQLSLKDSPQWNVEVTSQCATAYRELYIHR